MRATTPVVLNLKLKDAFTLVNLVAGIVAVHYALSGDLHGAGYAVLAGYLGGDLLDGLVARLTHTGNRFGAELDSIVDHFVHVVVPGLILYEAYRSGGHETLGLAIMGILVATATIRHARLAAARFDYPLCWCGLPRTLSGFVAMSYPLSRIVFADNPWRWGTGFVLVTVLAVLNLAPIPYTTHRGGRALQSWVKVGLVIFWGSPVVLFVVARSYVFDMFGLCLSFYAIFGWWPLSREERAAFYREYRRWSASLSE